MAMQLATQPTSSAKARILQKNDDDVVIVSAIRTAITKVSLDCAWRNPIQTDLHH